MKDNNPKAHSVQRVMVATDRSGTADRAVRWAAEMAAGVQGELILLQVLVLDRVDRTAVDVDEAI